MNTTERGNGYILKRLIYPGSKGGGGARGDMGRGPGSFWSQVGQVFSVYSCVDAYSIEPVTVVQSCEVVVVWLRGTAGNHAGVGTHKGDWPGEYIAVRSFG